MGTDVKTSIRLVLTSFAVSCVTLAAAGTPLPFFGNAPAVAAPVAAPLPVSVDPALAGMPDLVRVR